MGLMCRCKRLLAACGTVLLAACGGVADEPVPPAELRIGMLLEVDKVDAVPARTAAQLAVDAVNDGGGVLIHGQPHRLTLVVEGTGGAPDRAAHAALKLINQEKIVALVGSSRSTLAVPIAEVAERARVPMISPYASHPDVTAGRDYAFRVTFLDDQQGRALALFARRDLGARRGAVLYDATVDYSRGIAEVFRQAFEENEKEEAGTIVAYEPYSADEADVRPQMRRIAAAEADVLLLPNYSGEAREHARQARIAGVQAILLGTDAWVSKVLAENPDFDGSYMSTVWHPTVSENNPASRSFVKAMRRHGGQDTSMSLAAAAYDAVGLLAAALRQAGSENPAAVRNALADIEGYNGATGTISFRGTGGDPRRNVQILQLKPGGAHFIRALKGRELKVGE